MSEIAKPFGALMVLAVAVTVSSSPQESGCVRAEKLVQQANRLAVSERGLIDRQQLYREAVELCPGHVEAQNGLGDTYERLERFDQALEAYRKAIEIKKDWALPYFGLGDVYRKLNKPDEALYWYEQGLGWDPDDQETQSAVRALRAADPPDIVIWRSIAPTLDVTRGPGVSESIAFDEKRLQFDFDRATLRPEAHAQIREIAFALTDRFSPTRSVGVLASAGSVLVEIAGHSDRRGTDEYNLDLAKRRAEAVVDELAKTFNIPRSRMRAMSYGRSRPLCGEDTEECHARNRRVELRRAVQ